MTHCSNKRRATGLAYPRTCSVCGLGPCRETSALNPPEPTTNTVKHTPDAREWQQPLWAVSIQGPDDLVPVASYLDALRVANAFNAWWQAFKTEKPLHEYDPRMWAIPVEWTGDAERHSWWIENPSPDYAAFVTPEKEDPAVKFGAWLSEGPKLAKAAGCHVGIKVTPAPQEKGRG